MKIKTLYIATIFALILLSSINTAAAEKHLFILSGQSNMAGIDPNASFTPTVEVAFGKDNVTVVKDAKSGMPIRMWYKNWKSAQGEGGKGVGNLYDRLMKKVNEAIKGNNYTTVTFVWMQGERDAKEKHDSVYKKSMLGLIKQLSDDLKRNDINYVIGRLSKYKNDINWNGIRKAQVEAAEASPRGAWLDTDTIDRGWGDRIQLAA